MSDSERASTARPCARRATQARPLASGPPEDGPATPKPRRSRGGVSPGEGLVDGGAQRILTHLSGADISGRDLQGQLGRDSGTVTTPTVLPEHRRIRLARQSRLLRSPASRRSSRGMRSARRTESALVELRIRGGPVPHWMQDLGARWGAGVRLHVCRPTESSPRKLLQLLEITATPEAFPEITACLRQRASPKEVSLTRLSPHRLLVRLVGPLPALCHTVFEMGAICMSCPFLPSPDLPEGESREGEWRVLVHRVRDARPLLASFTTPDNSPASLVRIGAFQGPHDLTARQEIAVGTAFVLGYFDYPRRAQLKDVAKSLGVSRAAAMENLRRGMRKLAFRHRGEVGIVRTRTP